jgi:uncharacterized protein (DUF2062 family)
MKKQHSPNPIVSLFRQLRLALIRIYRAKGTPHEIALGVGIGAFWGVFPTFGLSTLLILGLYRFFRFNIITAFAGALVSNPFTSPFLLYFSYQVGALFISAPQSFDIKEWWNNLDKVGWVMLVGSTILSTVVAVILYFVAYLVAKRTQKKT